MKQSAILKQTIISLILLLILANIPARSRASALA